MKLTLASILSLALVAQAKNIDIQTGKGGMFTPSDIKCDKGDTLTFYFYKDLGGHSVVSSDFDKPCQANGKIFSGQYSSDTDGPGDKAFVMTCEDTNPVWIFCGNVGHCKSGMVAAINAPSTGDQTLEKYKAAAMKTEANTQPVSGQVAGGEVKANDESGGASSSAAAGTTMATSAAAATTAAATTTAASPPAATGNDAPPSSYAGLGVVLLVAVANALLMA